MCVLASVCPCVCVRECVRVCVCVRASVRVLGTCLIQSPTSMTQPLSSYQKPSVSFNFYPQKQNSNNVTNKNPRTVLLLRDRACFNFNTNYNTSGKEGILLFMFFFWSFLFLFSGFLFPFCNNCRLPNNYFLYQILCQYSFFRTPL